MAGFITGQSTQFVRRTTRAGVLAGMFAGLISTLLWPYLGMKFDQTLFGFASCAVGLFGVTLTTGHHPEEHVAAVLFEDLPSARRGVSGL
jgi:SSS family solute:Na+ symporter